MPRMPPFFVAIAFTALGGCAGNPIDLIPPSELALIERDMQIEGELGQDQREGQLSVANMLAAVRGDAPSDEDEPEVEEEPESPKEPARRLSIDELLARVRAVDESQREGDSKS